MRTLTLEEVEEVSGGVTAGDIGIGLGMLALGVSLAVAAGIAALPVGVILGAGTIGEIMVGATAVTLSGVGGVSIGNGLTEQDESGGS